MSKRLWFLALFAALVVSTPVWLSGAAQAGPTLCGNGDPVLDPGETCDDGNTTSGDGCSADCLIEDCGDGIPTPDTEECDDGNTVSGDGCAADCTSECGDGTVQAPLETCDTTGESATCDDDCTEVDCGDENVNEAAGETCDDGNTVDTDACPNNCQGIVPPPTKKQQACINAANKNLAGVVKAQTGDTTACLKSAAGGDPFATCYGTDLKGKVGKAQTKTTNTVAGKKCTGEGLPTNPVVPVAATINDAGELQTLEGSTILLGDPATIALKADKEASGCQAEAMKHYNAILNKWIQEANKAKKTAIKGGKGGTPPPTASAAELATALDTALDDNAQVVKTVTKASTGLTKKCTDTIVDANFDCAGAATVEALRACIAIISQAAACEAFELADGLDLNCPALPAP